MSTSEKVTSKVCWAELMTKDAAQAEQFYGPLFGWEFKKDDIPGGGFYTMLQIGGRNVGGMFELTEEMANQGIPPNWMPYVSVASADATAKKTLGLGGKVERQPFDVMDIGRMAVISDPTGATISVWEAKGASDMGFVEGEPGTLCWIELLTRNVDRAGQFYGTLFGWKPEFQDVGGMHYTVFRREEEKYAAGMMALDGPMFEGVPPHWGIYLHVADCRASVARAESLGATVLAPPMEVPTVGTFATLADPQGAVFSVLQPAPMAE